MWNAIKTWPKKIICKADSSTSKVTPLYWRFALFVNGNKLFCVVFWISSLSWPLLLDLSFTSLHNSWVGVFCLSLTYPLNFFMWYFVSFSPLVPLFCVPIYWFLKNLKKNQCIVEVGWKTFLDLLMKGELEWVFQNRLQLDFEYLHT